MRSVAISAWSRHQSYPPKFASSMTGSMGFTLRAKASSMAGQRVWHRAHRLASPIGGLLLLPWLMGAALAATADKEVEAVLAGDLDPDLVVACAPLSALPAEADQRHDLLLRLLALVGGPETRAGPTSQWIPLLESAMASPEGADPAGPVMLAIRQETGEGDLTLSTADADAAVKVLESLFPGGASEVRDGWMLGETPDALTARLREGVLSVQRVPRFGAQFHATPTLVAGLPEAPGCVAYAATTGPDGATRKLATFLPTGPEGTATWRQMSPDARSTGPLSASEVPTRPVRSKARPRVVLVHGARPEALAADPFLAHTAPGQAARAWADLGLGGPELQVMAGTFEARFDRAGTEESVWVLPVVDAAGKPASADLLTRQVERAAKKRGAAVRSEGSRMAVGTPPTWVAPMDGRVVLGSDRALVVDVSDDDGQPWFDTAATAQVARFPVGWVWQTPDGAAVGGLRPRDAWWEATVSAATGDSGLRLERAARSVGFLPAPALPPPGVQAP